MSELSPQQAQFAIEYLKDSNGTQAAIRAGYAESGAHVQATRLLKKAKILSIIEKGNERIKNKLEISIDKVKEEIAKCGFSNMQDYMSVDEDGHPHLDFSKLTREQAAALGEVTVEEYVEGKGKNARPVKKVKFKLLDKLSALEKLGKHLGMFKEEPRVSVSFHFDSEMAQELAKLARPIEGEFEKLN